MLTVSVCVSPLVVVVVVWGFILFYRFYLTDGPCTYVPTYVMRSHGRQRKEIGLGQSETEINSAQVFMKNP